jgi:hypothetical protein
MDVFVAAVVLLQVLFLLASRTVLQEARAGAYVLQHAAREKHYDSYLRSSITFVKLTCPVCPGDMSADARHH